MLFSDLYATYIGSFKTIAQIWTMNLFFWNLNFLRNLKDEKLRIGSHGYIEGVCLLDANGESPMEVYPVRERATGKVCHDSTLSF